VACFTRITFWRPLASLSDEEVQLLDGITKKLTAPAVLHASPDARQNQIESKPAIEAEVVESELTVRASERKLQPSSY
jgi:hypothetical protein